MKDFPPSSGKRSMCTKARAFKYQWSNLYFRRTVMCRRRLRIRSEGGGRKE